ncbi:hypothetical protein L249_4249 [Ophiocordyceps polyrhachis-furcata BCC 54312]|uniref:Uncharacterized protein n=1 Tax=Ophiocordyceps polyrhachis-furcata BCC 54312 TaxID=1330021 RepID=A0A367L819_9HYPO|nr:hypothetical protein L249_4249 [Ophiocordyceps polyrhachis-furcata BCC 54312]
MIMSNQGVDHVIEKKKTNHVMIGDLEEDFNVMDQPDDLTLVQRADRCDDRCNESIGRYDRYSPTVTQGVWPYRLISYPFKMKKYALYSS